MTLGRPGTVALRISVLLALSCDRQLFGLLRRRLAMDLFVCSLPELWVGYVGLSEYQHRAVDTLTLRD